MSLRFLVLPFFLFSFTAVPQPTAASGVLGNWSEPGGSVINVFQCGPNICARLAKVASNAPVSTDSNNPKASLRKQPLCGLRIGYDFHLTDPSHADGGKLYDPKTGKTYHGTMTAQADHLNLRGYVGFKAFGRSETWTRAAHAPAPCTA